MYKSNKELTEFAVKIGYPDSIKNGLISETYQSSEISDSLYNNPFFNIIENLFENISFKEALEFVKEIQSFSESDVETVADFYDDTSYAELSLKIPLVVVFFWFHSKQVINVYSTPQKEIWEQLSTSKNKSVHLSLRSNCGIYFISKNDNNFITPKDKIVFVDFSINYETKKSSLPKELNFGDKKIKVI